MDYTQFYNYFSLFFIKLRRSTTGFYDTMINGIKMVMIYRRESFNCTNSPLKVKLDSFEVKYSKYKPFSDSAPLLCH